MIYRETASFFEIPKHIKMQFKGWGSFPWGLMYRKGAERGFVWKEKRKKNINVVFMFLEKKGNMLCFKKKSDKKS